MLTSASMFLSGFFTWLFGWFASQCVTAFIERKKKKPPCARCAVWKKMAADQDALLGEADELLGKLTQEAQHLGLYGSEKKKETIQ